MLGGNLGHDPVDHGPQRGNGERVSDFDGHDVSSLVMFRSLWTESISLPI
jgi:hypothetical protein